MNVNYFQEKSHKFIEELPYLQKPYSKRNWGHAWHSICSYHGKLKPAIAYFLIKYFTKTGEKILDPLSGVGTIPFEACMQNRYGVGNDLSPMAYIVTKAKLESPREKQVFKSLQNLEKYIYENKKYFDSDNIPYNDFGFNGKVPEYFENETYQEILAGRKYLTKKLNENLSPEDAMVLSAFLHVLHGNRPYALSRRSHPLTPYSPKGPFKYKNVVEHIKNKIERNYNKKPDWDNFTTGKALWDNYKNLDNKIDKVDAIITSPPFTGSLRFYTSNWLRLWLTGWEPKDFKNAKNKFLEAKQKNSLDVYQTFFKICFKLLKQNGILILHLGKSKNCDMAKELEKRTSNYFRTIYMGEENVRNLEKHGIKDKGKTTDHQFLFLLKN